MQSTNRTVDQATLKCIYVCIIFTKKIIGEKNIYTDTDVISVLQLKNKKRKLSCVIVCFPAHFTKKTDNK